MLFQKRFHDRIRSGEITTTVRIWKSQRVSVGKRYRVGDGCIEVDDVRRINFDDITPRLARASGFPGVTDLLKTARHGSGEQVYVVRFHHVGASVETTDPGTLAPQALADLANRLEAMDRRSRSGPWTLETLRAIRRHPGRRAADLAAATNRDRDTFKADVRKLKRLGLTVSLEVGYRLSAAGEQYLAERPSVQHEFRSR